MACDRGSYVTVESTRPAPALQILRIIAAAFMIVPIFIGLALAFVFVPHGGSGAFGPKLLVPVILGAAAFLFQVTFGFRAPAIAVGAPRRSYLPDFQSRMFIRLALAEVVLFVSLALAFVWSDTGFVMYAVGAAVTEILLIVNGWPSQRVIEKFRRNLERDGGQSYLSEDLGLPTTGLSTAL